MKQITSENLKAMSGKELAEFINEVNNEMDKCQELSKGSGLFGDQVSKKRWDEEYEICVDLLGMATEEYIYRFNNGGDLEGYNETLIKIDD